MLEMEDELLYDDLSEDAGSYDKHHTIHHCDKCGKEVGLHNLYKSNYLYKDLNDKVHKDYGDGYRLYYLCDYCHF